MGQSQKATQMRAFQMPTDKTTVIKFFIYGNPEPQARPRKGRYGNFYSPRSNWRDIVALSSRQMAHDRRYDGPIKVSMTFILPRPKSVAREWPCVKPDISNIAKGTEDSINESGLWKDDALICELRIIKRYVRGDERPGCWVEIEELT